MGWTQTSICIGSCPCTSPGRREGREGDLFKVLAGGRWAVLAGSGGRSRHQSPASNTDQGAAILAMMASWPQWTVETDGRIGGVSLDVVLERKYL